MQFQLLGNNVTFKPDRKGRARTPNAEFQIKNASEYGVIYGGQMEFELTLQGKEWRQGLEKLGLTLAKSQRLNVPVRVEVGNASHAATAELQCYDGISRNDLRGCGTHASLARGQDRWRTKGCTT